MARAGRRYPGVEARRNIATAAWQIPANCPPDIAARIEAMRQVVVKIALGEDGHTGRGMQTRLQAAQDQLDRELGRAKERVEHSGANGEPLSVAIQIGIIQPPAQPKLAVPPARRRKALPAGQLELSPSNEEDPNVQ